MIGFIAKRLVTYALLLFAMLFVVFVWWTSAPYQPPSFLDSGTIVEVYR